MNNPRRNQFTTIEPINDPVNGGYSWLMDYYCLYCKQHNLIIFKGAKTYKCKCGKVFQIIKEDKNN